MALPNNEMSIDQILNLPPDPDNIILAYNGIKQALNKANSRGVFDLKQAGTLSRGMTIILSAITEIRKSCYQDDKDEKQPQQLHIPSDKKTLRLTMESIKVAINDANIKGTYETIDDSAELCACLMIIEGIINGLVSILENEERNKKKTSTSKEQLQV